MLMRVLHTILAAVLLSGCASKSVEQYSDYGTIYSPAMEREMEYSVYTPPGWTKTESLPLMVLLHGAWDNHVAFDRYEVGNYLDAQVEAGKLPRVIIVNPDGERGFWENWHDGTRNYRDWVIDDLMPHIEKQYATKSCPDHCYISGISMGAHGAMRFAYYEPGTFASTAAISGKIITKEDAKKSSWKNFFIRLFIPINRIWGDIRKNNDHIPKDLDPYVSWVKKPELHDMRLFLAWGDDDHDGIIRSNAKFQQHLENNNKSHTWLVYQGRHKWVDWKEIVAESIRFHVDGQTRNGTNFSQKMSSISH